MDRSETDCPSVIREDRIREIHAEHFSRGSPHLTMVGAMPGKKVNTEQTNGGQHWRTRWYGTGSGSDLVTSEAYCDRRRPVATAPGTIPMSLGPI
jgi:hypothetical protein